MRTVCPLGRTAWLSLIIDNSNPGALAPVEVTKERLGEYGSDPRALASQGAHAPRWPCSTAKLELKYSNPGAQAHDVVTIES